MHNIMLFMYNKFIAFFADSIYTERYMVTPSENEKGYRVSVLLCHDR
jgi:hypothetical protein